jgi:hypothetical protein
MSDASISPELRVLLDVLDCAFDKRSWHGANLMAAIRGVDAKSAARRVRGRKCVWEQVLHAAYWKHVALNKIDGTTPFARSGSNWLKIPDGGNVKHWKADVALLRETQRRLRDVVARLKRRQLDEKTIWLIHGAAAHDLYHAGQIKLLRKMLASSKSDSSA